LRFYDVFSLGYFEFDCHYYTMSAIDWPERLIIGTTNYLSNRTLNSTRSVHWVMNAWLTGICVGSTDLRQATKIVGGHLCGSTSFVFSCQVRIQKQIQRLDENTKRC